MSVIGVGVGVEVATGAEAALDLTPIIRIVLRGTERAIARENAGGSRGADLQESPRGVGDTVAVESERETGNRIDVGSN